MTGEENRPTGIGAKGAIPVSLSPGLLVSWSFLGPVFFYDVVRSARRQRAVLFRCLYALVLLVVLCWVYGTWFAEQGNRGGWFEDGSAAAVELTRFAERFFDTFFVVQYAAVLVLTPVYASGAIAEEKERG